MAKTLAEMTDPELKEHEKEINEAIESDGPIAPGTQLTKYLLRRRSQIRFEINRRRKPVFLADIRTPGKDIT
jgi:hypothetical protein